ncbi:MAG: S8 family serine peptidase [Pseudomonadota bacterium]
MFYIESLHNNGFSWETALSMASASQIVYEPKSVVEEYVKDSWGFDTVNFIDIENTQSFWAENSHCVIWAFRGSDSIGDWLANLSLETTNHNVYGDLHQGFYSAYKLIEDHLLSSVSNDKRVFLTGHSLGGAIATLACAELTKRLDHLSTYTFGQPRVGKTQFREWWLQNHTDNLYRFVNDEDIVTRLPPNFDHVGALITLSSHEAKKTESSSELTSDASTAMSSEEFEALRSRIKGIYNSLSESNPNKETHTDLDLSVEGVIPGIRDHKIQRYINNIRRKLSKFTASGIDASGPLRIESTTGDFGFDAVELDGDSEPHQSQENPQDIPILLRLSDSNWRAPHDLKIGSRVGDFVTAQASRNVVERLSADPMIEDIIVSADGGIEELDQSLPYVKGDFVHMPPLNERGDSALIGIIDSGIDVFHKAFRDVDGQTRIKGIWDQRDNTGPSPYKVDPTKFTQDYGTLYLSGDINTDISRNVARSLSLRDRGGHGTHVASIAAGSKIPGKLGSGVAPESGLIGVITNSIAEQGSTPSLGYSVSHVDALAFLKAAAEGGNMVNEDQLPIAINVSLGMNAGAHDGTSLVERAFDSISGGGRDPGFVIVKSAGNERGKAGHKREQAAQGQTVILKWNSSGVRDQDYIELWYDKFDQIEFQLEDPSGGVSNLVNLNNRDTTYKSGGNISKLRLTPNHRDNGDNLLRISIFPEANQIQSGEWKLKVTGIKIRSRHGNVDLWVERTRSTNIRFHSSNDSRTLSIPGTADTVITVAASDANTPFLLTNSSSYGLTRDGRAKPDIVAPGYRIKAAKSNRSNHDETVAYTGTSMAAPHVTGALALVMSAQHKKDPSKQFNAQNLQSALVTTTQTGGGVHSKGSGFGMLDVSALLKALI